MTTSTDSAHLDAATLEILWSRLVGITDEMWTTILKTSFSTIISQALDYGVALLDVNGGLIAHASGSMPIFNNALPTICRDLLARFGGRIEPGDVYGGNDPWLCCGHLPDLAILTPVFKDRKLVAFASSVAHHIDFGGGHGHKRVREIYDEGIFVPVMRFYYRGKRVDPVYEIIGSNVRTPELVLGDIEAQVAAGEVGARAMVRLMDEYGLDDMAGVINEIETRSERAMRNIIRSLPDGTYSAEGWADLHPDPPIKLAVQVTIAGDEIFVDFAGTGPQVESGGVNVTLSFTRADANYAIKCVLAPELPHNEGTTRPIHVSAPEGSALNCTFPASVSVRTRVSHHADALVVRALAPLVPHLAPASSGMFEFLRLVGTYPDGRGFNTPLFGGGGRGGSMHDDGIGGFIYPSSAGTVQAEVFEMTGPGLLVEKEFLPDSMGPGKHRGGPGQRIVLRRRPGYPLPVRVRFTSHCPSIPAAGLFDGQAGLVSGDVRWNGKPISLALELGRDGYCTLASDDDTLSFNVASGGGYGDPRERDHDLIEADIRSGLLTPAAAARDYAFRPTRGTADP
jgi:N-methylhydantoinase B/oxoprolinase/acetone carboxylase alpha subunit